MKNCENRRRRSMLVSGIMSILLPLLVVANFTLRTYSMYTSVETGTVNLKLDIYPVGTMANTIYLDPNTSDGEEQEAITVYEGYLVSPVEPPVWEGHTFLGYYTETSDGEEVFNKNGVPNEDFDLSKLDGGSTLYGHWS